MGLSFDGVKGLALQAAVADAAGEAGYVEHAIHGRAAGAFADDLQSAIGTHSCMFFSFTRQTRGVMSVKAGKDEKLGRPALTHFSLVRRAERSFISS